MIKRPRTLWRVFTPVLFVAVSCLISAAQISAQTASRERRIANSDLTNKTLPPSILPALPKPVLTLDKALPPLILGATPKIKPPSQKHFEHLLQSAIETRIGTPYLMGATGPDRFDCSGFVWSVFQEVGINFERSSAYSLWQMFAPARIGEEQQFGTLVFFNNLRHVGIVADDKGFYHASSSHGVTYSLFDGYWAKRIVGFRRVPLNAALVAE